MSRFRSIWVLWGVGSPLKVGRCPCIGVFWTFVGGLESADDELSGREKARGDSYSEWGLVEM